MGHAMSDRKSQFIAICMFIGAVTMIGLALTGALQMRVAHSPVVLIERLTRPRSRARRPVVCQVSESNLLARSGVIRRETGKIG
jgi:hypothetical protein